MSNDSGSPQPQLDNWRLTAFAVVIGIVFIVFTARLFSFQILQQTNWVSQAEENRTNTISIPTHRGVIFDRNGAILAQNIASYNIAVTPALLPDDDGEIQEIIRALSEFTTLPLHLGDIETEPLIQCGDNLGISEMVAIGASFSPFSPVLVDCDIDRNLALVIQEKSLDWPGVSIEVEPIRDYPTGDLTSTVIGFLGPIPQSQETVLRALGFVPRRDKVGYAGIELFLDETLRGTPGRRVVEVDVAGEVLRDIESILPPQEGLNVKLTIDLRLQNAMDAIFEDEISQWNTFFFGNTGGVRISSGAVIAMNPKTGEVLGMVSFPSYENNRLARFIPAYYYDQLISDSTQPLINNAVGAELPAGSVFKIVTSVGALNEEVVTPNQIVKTPGKIVVQQEFTANDPGVSKEFVDWNRAGFGQLDFYGGISNSSNVYFYKIGGGYASENIDGLGICRLGTYAEAMGFNNILGIELPEETDGLIPNPTWKRINQGENWSTGDTYISAVGQGFVISTPLQVLVSANIIANNGVFMRPTVVKEVLDNDGNVVPVVTDQYGNLLDLPLDAQGNVIGEAFDNSGNPIDPLVVSPWKPDIKWDLTKDALIEEYENPLGIGSCKPTGVVKTVDPWVFQAVQTGMRRAVTHGTLKDIFEGFNIPVAGKTGTAEYCDVVALSKNLCIPGNWPTHSWSLAYAPFDDPEIAVVAFLYNGGEGASVA
ncbi:MAG: penicillin-binding transpeptidase domain-containing protein, partial [Chloroflexota bacterium]